MAGGIPDEEGHLGNVYDHPRSGYDWVQEEERESRCLSPWSKYRMRIFIGILLVIICILIIICVKILVSLVNKPTLNPLLATSDYRRRPCLPAWIGYQMKCFYFSDKEETFSASQDFCSLYNASLAIIEKKEEMDFVLRHKGTTSHWIGLQRDPNQPWKWINGNASTWKVLGDGGNCAFLNDEGRASCSRCHNAHHWICSKPDEFTSPKIV